uniref:Uncharacterized protein n=1 Tax=Rhizophora mucronata TaxID=61149 RepID=A0A2P2IXF9_RHIMU
MGASLWQGVLCLVGDSPSLSIPQRSNGSPKPYTNHCCSLVSAAGICLLPCLGEDQSIC